MQPNINYLKDLQVDQIDINEWQDFVASIFHGRCVDGDRVVFVGPQYPGRLILYFSKRGQPLSVKIENMPKVAVLSLIKMIRNEFGLPKTKRIGQMVAFASESYVTGWYRDEAQGYQIRPIHEGMTTIKSAEIADCPFIIEFEYIPSSGDYRRAKHRRVQEIARCLNLFLDRRIYVSLAVPRQVWTQGLNLNNEVRWSGYQTALDDIAEFSHPARKAKLLDPKIYHEPSAIFMPKELTIPADLSELEATIELINEQDKERLQAAMIWYDAAMRAYYSDNPASSLIALATTIEAVMPDCKCETCVCANKKECTHDSHEEPRKHKVEARFKAFLEANLEHELPEKRELLKKFGDIYSLRSGLVHGSRTLYIDEFLWDFNTHEAEEETRLYNTLSYWVKIAVINWLRRAKNESLE